MCCVGTLSRAIVVVVFRRQMFLITTLAPGEEESDPEQSKWKKSSGINEETPRMERLVRSETNVNFVESYIFARAYSFFCGKGKNEKCSLVSKSSILLESLEATPLSLVPSSWTLLSEGRYCWKKRRRRKKKPKSSAFWGKARWGDKTSSSSSERGRKGKRMSSFRGLRRKRIPH